VISWFQAFAFKWVNLYRYSAAHDAVFQVAELGDVIDEVGRCKLHSLNKLNSVIVC
jgi:hypothetical protein